MLRACVSVPLSRRGQQRSVGFTGIPSEGAIRKARMQEGSDMDYSAFTGILDDDDPPSLPSAPLPVRSQQPSSSPNEGAAHYPAKSHRYASQGMYAPASYLDRLKKDYFRFSKTRPLPQVPWLQDTRRTYLDDAERMFGRKEQWQSADHDTRMKLVMVLREFLQDTTRSSNELALQTRERERKLGRLSKEYTSFVVAGAEDPSTLKAWRRPKSAADILREEESADMDNINSLRKFSRAKEDVQQGGSDDGEVDEGIGRHVDAVRGEMLDGDGDGGGVAMGGLSKSALKSALPSSDRSYSQYPFLRRRVQEDAESLDPSLIDWTKQYFPEDDDKTFALPPSLTNQAAAVSDDDVDEKEVEELRMSQALAAKGSGADLSQKDRQLAAAASSRMRSERRMRRAGMGRYALSQTLSEKVNSRMTVFDAEGVHYRRGSDITNADPSPGGMSVDSEGIPRTQKPRVLKMRGTTDVRDSFLEKRYRGRPSTGGRGAHEVFSADTLAGDRAAKVDWASVSAQRNSHHGRSRGPQWHRANERLIRMTRGEEGDRL